MDLKPENLLIFLLAILPGAVALRAKISLVPRSLEAQSTVSEIGDYVLTSAWIHVPALVLFRIVLFYVMGQGYFTSMTAALRDKGINSAFVFDHWKLVFAYFLTMVIGGYGFGLLRGYQIRTRRFQKHLLKKLGVSVALEDRTLWNLIMDGDQPESHDTWVEAELKESKGFYSGRIKTYPIVADSEPNKEFYLEPASFKENRSGKYQDLPQGAGVLLTFSEVVSLRISRLKRPAAMAAAASASARK